MFKFCLPLGLCGDIPIDATLSRRLQELFNSERGVYLDGRLQQAIRRVLDLQFKGVPPSFQITCGKCKKVIDTNEHDPVSIRRTCLIACWDNRPVFTTPLADDTIRGHVIEIAT